MNRAVGCLAVLASMSAATGALSAEWQKGPASAAVGDHVPAHQTAPAPELPVKAWRVFGTGRADAAPQAVNPPDGLAFTADGLLLATDADNHRVQIFDPASGARLGSFGGPETFVGQVVAIAVAPDGSVLVSDEEANRAHLFRRVPGSPRFVSAGPPVLQDAGFRRLTGVAYDSAGRLYAVDGLSGEVRRYLPGLTPDPAWDFQCRRPDGKPMLHRADGIAICEGTGEVFLSSEWDGMVRVCDLATGRWFRRTFGRQADPVSGQPIGSSVFSRSVEGLAILGDYLLAVDEGSDIPDPTRPGRLLVFQLRDPAMPKSDAEPSRARGVTGRLPTPIGWMGTFQSPDGVAAFPGSAERPEPLVAVADQGNYRVIVYRGSELLREALAVLPKATP